MRFPLYFKGEEEYTQAIELIEKALFEAGRLTGTQVCDLAKEVRSQPMNYDTRLFYWSGVYVFWPDYRENFYMTECDGWYLVEIPYITVAGR